VKGARSFHSEHRKNKPKRGGREEVLKGRREGRCVQDMRRGRTIGGDYRVPYNERGYLP